MAVSKLSDRGIRSITRQWKRGRPIRDLADYHHVSRQRIYQIIAAYRQTGLYPYPQAPGRKPAQIPHETETLVLAAQDQYSLGPTHLEKKIEEEYRMHIPHNTIYRILLEHGRVEVCNYFFSFSLAPRMSRAFAW